MVEIVGRRDNRRGELWRRMMMSERRSGWLMMMTGPHAAAERRASNDGAIKKFSNPGRFRIRMITMFRSSNSFRCFIKTRPNGSMPLPPLIQLISESLAPRTACPFSRRACVTQCDFTLPFSDLASLHEDLLDQEVSLVGYDVFERQRSRSCQIHAWNEAHPLPSCPMPTLTTVERIA